MTTQEATAADLIRAAITFWAFWAFAFGVIFILVFRKAIAAFIGRLRKVGRGEWSAETDEGQQEQKPATTSAMTEALAQGAEKKADPRRASEEILRRIPRNEYVADREEWVKKALTEGGLVPNEPETYRVLVALLASVATNAEFEGLYNVIWASQIEIVQVANERVLTQEEVRGHYDHAATISPAVYEKYPFEAYLKFLTDQNLLMQPDIGKFQITVKGRTFLLHMVNTGKSKNRAIY